MVNALKKIVLLLLMTIVSLQVASAATVNVVDVLISEEVFQEVTYDPLTTGSGLYFDPNEQQSQITMNGSIVVTNNHPTDAINDIILNVTTASNIANVTFSSGSTGIVSQSTADYALLVIPDLGPGATSTFTYDINVSSVAPPLNLTTSYTDFAVFSGLPVTVTDNLQNSMNTSLYTDTCIHNINITQDTLAITQGPEVLNFTYDDTSLAGTDSSNASISADNRTLTWLVHNNGCLDANNVTDINYVVNSPSGVATGATYAFINSTISYDLNTSVSQVSVETLTATGDLEVNFNKQQINILTGDNATWNITSYVDSLSNISVNLTQVSLWVSTRNGTGTGFTDPSIVDNDTVSGDALNITYNPGTLLNFSEGGWNNSGASWLFNYTFSSSPIVWMNLSNTLINDGIQLTNRSITYGNSEIYVKEIYVSTGYWLEITKNITRLNDNNYSVYIEVRNRGTSPTPASQVVVIYSFLPILFNLTSTFDFSTSNWYNSSETNETLTDQVYNGTMYQFALIPNVNIYNSSLAAYNGSYNINNTWSVTYNISGSGEFNFEDLFLTGVDPLNVKEYGGTKALSVENVYRVLSGKVEYFLMGIAAIIGVLVLAF